MSTSWLQVYWLIHYCTRIYYSMIRSVDQFACQQPVGWSVSCLPVGVFVCLFVCLSVDACFCLCIYLSVCLYVCFVYRSVCRWSVWRSVGLYVCLSLALGQSVCGQSVYVPVCVPLSVYICLPTCLSLSLSVYLFAAGRSVINPIANLLNPPNDTTHTTCARLSLLLTFPFNLRCKTYS
jgi:hypothetical protein